MVQQDEHAVRVAEVALVLLDLGPCERPAEFGEEGAAEELGHRQVRHVRELGVQLFASLGGHGRTQPKHVHERTARIAHRLQHALEAAARVVLDDDAGSGCEVGLEVGVGAPRIADRDGHPRIVEAARQRLAVDNELDFEAGQQDLDRAS